MPTDPLPAHMPETHAAGTHAPETYTIYVGADHRGFEKKNQLIKLLAECHPGMVQVKDLGAYEYVQDDDFNDPACAVAAKVSTDDHAFGVLLCGSGQGVCIQANRILGVRAVCVKSADDAVLGREHDWANVLCMPADVLDASAMEAIVKAFCHARPLDTERHRRRMYRLDHPQDDIPPNDHPQNAQAQDTQAQNGGVGK